LLNGAVGLDRPVRLLGNLAERSGRRVAAGRDDLPDERLPRDDADEAALVAHEDGSDLRPRERLARLLRARVGIAHARVGDHRFADEGHG
jgi:hypothetical protein